MFTIKDREAVRSELLRAAQADPRITGAALTGSASIGNEDRWSDVDLAFGVREASEIETTLGDYSERMYRDYHALHHVDVTRGSWIYRVFLLPNTLQVDLAFAPANDFRARGRTFRLVFGSVNEGSPVQPTAAEEVIGLGWLYALHVRSSIARNKLWQAEYMLGAMRDQVFALACVRHGLDAREGRGIDRLPVEVSAPLQDGLVRSLEVEELVRAFRVIADGLEREMRYVAPDLTSRLAPTLRELTDSAAGTVS